MKAVKIEPPPKNTPSLKGGYGGRWGPGAFALASSPVTPLSGRCEQRPPSLIVRMVSVGSSSSPYVEGQDCDGVGWGELSWSVDPTLALSLKDREFFCLPSLVEMIKDRGSISARMG